MKQRVYLMKVLLQARNGKMFLPTGYAPNAALAKKILR